MLQAKKRLPSQNFVAFGCRTVGERQFYPVPLMMKAVVGVVAEELGATIFPDDEIGSKVQRIREWRFPGKGLDYGTA